MDAHRVLASEMAGKGRTEKPRLAFEFEQIDLCRIPAAHPVAIFAQRYAGMVDGYLVPDARKMMSDAIVPRVAPWLQYVEPVMRGILADFLIRDVTPRDGKDSRPRWMDDVYDANFVTPRYHEAVAASVLRQPMYSRGTVPSDSRSFILQYRGVFPLFTDNQPRLSLAIVAAETYIEIHDES